MGWGTNAWRSRAAGRHDEATGARVRLVATVARSTDTNHPTISRRADRTDATSPRSGVATVATVARATVDGRRSTVDVSSVAREGGRGAARRSEDMRTRARLGQVDDVERDDRGRRGLAEPVGLEVAPLLLDEVRRVRVRDREVEPLRVALGVQVGAQEEVVPSDGGCGA
jgi:hypothetical protein